MVKEDGILKERFEDNFILDWLIEDVWTNLLKGYFRAKGGNKSMFTTKKKAEAVAYWEDLTAIPQSLGTLKINRKRKFDEEKDVNVNDNNFIEDDANYGILKSSQFMENESNNSSSAESTDNQSKSSKDKSSNSSKHSSPNNLNKPTNGICIIYQKFDRN